MNPNTLRGFSEDFNCDYFSLVFLCWPGRPGLGRPGAARPPPIRPGRPGNPSPRPGPKENP